MARENEQWNHNSYAIYRKMGYLNVFDEDINNREGMRTFLYFSLIVLFYSEEKRAKA